MDIQAIAAAAAQVAHEYDASVEAIDAKVKAEAELLTSVVEAAKPALRAISSKIRASYRLWWPDNVSTAEEESFHSDANGYTRGLRVAGERAVKAHERANSGPYEGIALFLLADGTFAESETTGTWSKWQGASSEWEAGLLRVGIEHVVRAWSLEEIVEAIGAAIEKAKGSREKVSAKARARAEQLSAIVTLLK